MRYLIVLISLLMSLKLSALPLTINTGDYQVEVEATVSLNIDVPIVVKQGGMVITLTPEKYANLTAMLQSIYKELGLQIVISMHPFAIEYFEHIANGFPARQEVVEYWGKDYGNTTFDYDDENLFPKVSPVASPFWDIWWERTDDQYAREDRSYINYLGNQVTRNVYVIPDISYEPIQ